MSVIIKLNGFYIGTVKMSISEITKAKKAGFTISKSQTKKGE